MHKIEIHVFEADLALQQILEMSNNQPNAVILDGQPIDMEKFRKYARRALVYEALDDGLIASAEYLIGQLDKLPYTAMAVILLEKNLKEYKRVSDGHTGHD